MRDYQESVNTGQTHRKTDGQKDAGQSDSYVSLCFTGDTKKLVPPKCHSGGIIVCNSTNTGDKRVSVAKNAISSTWDIIIMKVVLKLLPLLMQNLWMYLYRNP